MSAPEPGSAPSGDPAETPGDPVSGVPGVHLPRQARSRASFSRMLEAARQLLAEGGTGAVTVQEVVRRADVGVGSFYARFESREALLLYLHHRLWHDAEAWWRRFLAPERWRGRPAAVVVAEVSRVLVRSHFRHETELRAFWARAVARPAERMMERTAEWDTVFVQGLGRLLEERADEMSHPEPERAAGLAAFQLLANLRGHLFFPDSVAVRGPLSLEDLVLESVRACLGYLGVESGPEGYGDLLRVSADLPAPPAPSAGEAATDR